MSQVAFHKVASSQGRHEGELSSQHGPTYHTSKLDSIFSGTAPMGPLHTQHLGKERERERERERE